MTLSAIERASASALVAMSGALADAAIKGLVVLAVAACVVLVLRHASAAARHFAWVLAMAGLVALPVLGACLPQWRVLPAWTAAQTRDAVARDSVATELERGQLQSRPSNVDPEPQFRPEENATEITAGAIPAQGDRLVDVPGDDARLFAAAAVRSPGRIVAVTLVAVWLLGAVLSSLLHSIAWLRLAARGRRASVATGSLASLAAETLATLGLRRPVRVLLTPERSVPLTWGIISPRILLPAEAVDWPERQLRSALLHEGAHVLRQDCATQWLARLACTLYWFNPLVWIAAGQMAREREAACDDLVLQGGVRSSDYAHDLLHVAARYCGRRGVALAGVEMARRSQIEQRIRGILDAHRNRRPLARPARVIGALALGLVLVPLAMVAWGSEADDKPKAGDAKPAVASETSRDDKTAQADVAALPATGTEAERLVRAMYEGFSWVDRAKSMRIKTAYRIDHTEEDRRHEAAHPDKSPFGSNGKIDPRTFCVDTDWAWNETKVYRRSDSYYAGSEDPHRIDLRVWDGKLAVECQEVVGEGHQQYVFGDNAKQFFETLVVHMAYLPWGPGSPHHLWWSPVDVAKERTSWGILPEDFESEGRTMLNGRECHVVVSKVGHYRYYIGVDDGRLYRKTWLYIFTNDPKYDYLELCRAIGGPQIKTPAHWNAWTESLDPADRTQAWGELKRAQFPFLRPIYYHDFSDYCEVAPGCWMPMDQRLERYNFETDEPFVASVSTQKVTEVAVNEPLPESLFKFEPVDGVNVATDWRYDPPIRYTYNHAQTEEERVALCEAKKREQGETQALFAKLETVLRSRIGSAPPPLPTSGWFNSEGVTWEQLKGKVVVLHFWDVNCGPCKNDLPFLAGWHKGRDKSGIAVIGVHAPTTDTKAVVDEMKEFGVDYPVVIDPLGADGKGTLHEWFGNNWWPNIVLIDKQGRVADFGRLWGGDAGDKMRKLVASE